MVYESYTGCPVTGANPTLTKLTRNRSSDGEFPPPRPQSAEPARSLNQWSSATRHKHEIHQRMHPTTPTLRNRTFDCTKVLEREQTAGVGKQPSDRTCKHLGWQCPVHIGPKQQWQRWPCLKHNRPSLCSTIVAQHVRSAGKDQHRMMKCQPSLQQGVL